MADSSLVRRIEPREEPELVQRLLRACQENAYLLGLLSDFGIRALENMEWGWFFDHSQSGRLNDIFYLDTTGMTVLHSNSADAIQAYADFLVCHQLPIKRIISEAVSTTLLEAALKRNSSAYQHCARRFEEKGMILNQPWLAMLHEPNVRMAETADAGLIVDGAILAMEEELGLKTMPEDRERLLHSKKDLISKRRYFILKEGEEILFQAFFSAALPDVSMVQGVWVPHAHRNQGLATRCLAEVCHRQFQTTRCIVLRVQNRNLPAIRAYEKIGFRPFLDYLSLWFE